MRHRTRAGRLRTRPLALVTAVAWPGASVGDHAVAARANDNLGLATTVFHRDRDRLRGGFGDSQGDLGPTDRPQRRAPSC